MSKLHAFIEGFVIGFKRGFRQAFSPNGEAFADALVLGGIAGIAIATVLILVGAV